MFSKISTPVPLYSSSLRSFRCLSVRSIAKLESFSSPATSRRIP